MHSAGSLYAILAHKLISPWMTASRFLQAKPNCGRRGAFRSIGYASAGTEHGHQHFARVACCGTIGLNGSNGGAAYIALGTRVAFGAGLTLGTKIALWARLTLGTRRALRTLRPLCAGLALCSRDALHALRPLRAGWTLRTWLALRPGILAACAKRQSQTNCEYRKNPHATPPCYPAVIGGCQQVCPRHRRSSRVGDGPKVA